MCEERKGTHKVRKGIYKVREGKDKVRKGINKVFQISNVICSLKIAFTLRTFWLSESSSGLH